MRTSFLALFLITPVAMGQESEHVHLFPSGQHGYPRYRIPALIVTTKRTVLAFCEGRKDGRGLTGNIDIVLKRSLDSGKSWQPLTVVADDGTHTLGNPCPVVDRRDGTIWLLLTRSHGKDTEDEIVAGTSRETTKVLITSSKDDGLTWSPPRDITSSLRRADWTWYGTGPGIGIQLKSGRLVIPAYHAKAKTKIYRSHVLTSDDAGKTWKMSAPIGEHCSEAQIVERTDGALVLNARTVEGKERRTLAESRDGGATWGEAGHDENLYDPHCQASILRLDGSKDAKTVWLFCHPAGPGRRNLTIRSSPDEGKTWPASKLVRAGDAQYSCMTKLPDGSIGLLYESWVNGNYQLFFTRLPLDSLQVRNPADARTPARKSL